MEGAIYRPFFYAHYSLDWSLHLLPGRLARLVISLLALMRSFRSFGASVELAPLEWFIWTIIITQSVQERKRYFGEEIPGAPGGRNCDNISHY